MHALSGASGTQTTVVTPVAPSTNPAEIKLGEDFIWVFQGSGGHRPKSYSVTNLPDGITYSGKVTAGVASLAGRPTVPGNYQIRIRGYELTNLRGPSTPAYVLQLHVAAPQGFGTYENWVQDHGLKNHDALPLSDPDRDQSNNLLEYAFKYDPNVPEALAGAHPGFSPVTTPEIVRRTPASLQVAYLRRRLDSGVDVHYRLESSQDLEAWHAVDATEQIASIDPTWELVIAHIPIRRDDRSWYFRIYVAPH